MTDMATRRKLHEQVMAGVLGDIIEGSYGEGRRLPRELDLAAEYDVSRYVARETIQALRDRGVLTVKHGVGATIAPVEDWHLLDGELLEALLAAPRGRVVRKEAMEARLLLWPHIAALAAQRRTAEDLKRLELAVLERDDGVFQAALLTAAHNRFLSHVLRALDRHAVPAKKALRIRGSEAVLEAIRAGDPEPARAAMDHHPSLNGRRSRARSDVTGSS